ncbi:hypothetical protein [Methylocystis hirsuta]|uniref:Uncharacterized protein n=1 Tax=Methylocystis hirsuta TaxID=369798 RepID=A0A3M9XQT7_9HYPH|nr:hypothetical protein [Methylocystis hirsuta]RNJ49280.1 hypothetical protein D1O30_06385 [Methylocystis hirsuta]
MSAAFILLAIVLSAFAAFKLFEIFLAIDLDRLAKRAKWSGKFFSTTRDIISNDILPLEMIETLAFWNDAVADKSVPFLLAMALKNRQKKLLSSSKSKRSYKVDEERVFLQNNPEIADKYLDAIVYAITTIGYSHWLWGPAIRMTVADMCIENKKQRVEGFSRAVQREVRVSKHHTELASACCAT